MVAPLEKARWELYKNAGSSTLQNSNCMATYLPSQDMLGTTGKVRRNSEVIFSYGLLYMDSPVLTD